MNQAARELNSQGKNRILVVAHGPNLYGAERSLLDVISGLRSRGWIMDVIVHSAGPFTEKLDGMQVPYEVNLHKGWIGSQPRLLRIPYRLLLNIKSYRALVRKLGDQYGLVYTNTITKPMGLLLAAKFKTPHVIHVREFVDSDLGDTYDYGKSTTLKFVGRHSDKVICNSQAVMDGLKPYIPENKLCLVYNGLLDNSGPVAPSRSFPALDEFPFRLCMVGNLGAHKGHEDAIKALARLKKMGKNVMLQIAGSGHDGYLNKLLRLSEALGIQDIVEFLGYQNDVNKVFMENDLQLVCSRCEAFGRVAVESMALGVPVVGCHSGGLPEIVQNESNGLVYPPGDYAELANKICQIMDNPKLYEDFSAQGQKDVYQLFTAGSCIDQIEQTFQELLPVKQDV